MRGLEIVFCGSLATALLCVAGCDTRSVRSQHDAPATAQVSVVANFPATTNVPATQTVLKAVNYYELGASVQVIGRLGIPLGTVVSISGRPIRNDEKSNTYWAQNVARNQFLVHELQGGKLANPILLELSFDFHGGEELKLDPSTEFSFRGWEDGGFSFPPPEANEMSQFQRQFLIHFHVIGPPP